MIRLILYFLLIAAVASGLAWFADQPGSLRIEWLGEDIRTTVFVAVLILMVVFAALALLIWLGYLTVTTPRRIAQKLKTRRIKTGQEALRRGIFAAGAGDRVAALRAGAIAKKNIPDEPLTLLLEAQSAQLNEDAIASRQAFERMLEKPEMAELGLRGLYIEAKKSKQEEAAKQFAERALASNPALTWSSTALFEMQCKEEDWRAALKTLGIAKQHRHLPKAEAETKRALLLTALAMELEDTQPSKALAYALEAHSFIPSLTPAAIIAGRVLASQGNVSRATKLLTQAWRAAPHPDLALIYAHARTGDSPKDRLQRVKTLVSSFPASLEGDVAVAVAAIEAQEWPAARAALEPHLGEGVQARICRLMARIEAGQNRDAGRAREWLAKAARAAPDPTWVATDGSVSTEWRPRSPLSGALGTFEWKTPASEKAKTHTNATIPEIDALDIQPVPSSPKNLGADNDPKPDITNTTEAKAQEREKAATQATTSQENTTRAPNREVNATQNQATPSSLAAGKTSAPPSSSHKDVKKTEANPIPELEPVVSIDFPRPKYDARKPQIFISDRPPDDPGIRSSETEESSTPLSRFRSPSR